MATPTTYGPAYEEGRDRERLTKQRAYIQHLMGDGRWRTLGEIEGLTDYPQASISAQLRHLRKDRFGAYRVDKRRRTEGTWEYRVRAPAPSG